MSFRITVNSIAGSNYSAGYMSRWSLSYTLQYLVSKQVSVTMLPFSLQLKLLVPIRTSESPTATSKATQCSTEAARSPNSSSQCINNPQLNSQEGKHIPRLVKLCNCKHIHLSHIRTTKNRPL